MERLIFLTAVVLGLLVACTPAPSASPTSYPVTEKSTALAVEDEATGEDAESAYPGVTANEQETGAANPYPEPETLATDDGRVAEFPNTIVVYRREGRFPDSPQKWTFYHTGRLVDEDGNEWQLPAETVKPLFDFVESPDFSALDRSYTASGECLDCLQHVLTVYREGEVHEITFTEGVSDAPEELTWLLDEMETLVAEREQ
jgi:hypothetical protein